MPAPEIPTTAMMQDVKAFRDKVVRYPIPDVPTLLSPDRMEWFIKAKKEELAELLEAYAKGDLQGCSDAILDDVYFSLGRLVEMNVPAGPAWNDIHRRNMRKELGPVAKRGGVGHDAVKPPGWEGPDHSWMEELTEWDVENLRRRAARRKLQAEQSAEQRRLAAEGKQVGSLQFNAGKPRFTLVPKEGMEAEAAALEFGARKYATWDYLKGLPVMDNLNAAMRHIVDFTSGEDLDAESGVNHLGCVKARMSMVLCTLALHPELDDRRPSPITSGAE